MNKLFDYLTAARPIIMASAASNNPIEDAQAGITVPPEDSAALVEPIAALVAMPPTERAAMGHARRTYVEKQHGFDALAAGFAAMLDELMVEH